MPTRVEQVKFQRSLNSYFWRDETLQDLWIAKKDALKVFITVMVGSGLFIIWVREICVETRSG